MGLLDDAIREHLELKRRHGADPQEVARQEDEALGPIGGGEPHHEHDVEEPEHEHAHEVSEHQLAIDEPPTPYEPPAAAEHHEPEPPRVAEEDPEEPAFDVQQPTVEFSLEDEEEGEPAEDAEDAEPADELEETPEFLQETPEHDRLWFEQKPPRDFDF
jgi:hypothetical protein